MAMQKQLLYATLFFALGVTLGVFALWIKDDLSSSKEAQKFDSQNPTADSALSAKPSDNDTTKSKANINANHSNLLEMRKERHSAVTEFLIEDDKIQMVTSESTNRDEQMIQLERRISSLEDRILALQLERANNSQEFSEISPDILSVATPDDQRIALVAAGVTQTAAEEIVWRQSELELERLELKDQAIREGWYRTDKYFEAAREIDKDSLDLRSEIGEESYDEYLYKTGESNRVKVTSVIQGSAAELSGLMPGDIIESYAEERIYNYSDLQNATADGEREEKVPMLIRRGDVIIEADIMRGPMGVRIEAFSAPPHG